MQVECCVSLFNQAAGQAVVFDAAIVFDVILHVCIYEVQSALSVAISLTLTTWNVRESLVAERSMTIYIYQSCCQMEVNPRDQVQIVVELVRRIDYSCFDCFENQFLLYIF